jgi:hypothetical protein
MPALALSSKLKPITRPSKANALHQLTVVQIDKPDCEAIIINAVLLVLAVALGDRRNAADQQTESLAILLRLSTSLMAGREGTPRTDRGHV